MELQFDACPAAPHLTRAANIKPIFAEARPERKRRKHLHILYNHIVKDARGWINIFVFYILTGMLRESKCN